ncbi:MAG: autotransporter domain-containing protein [Puniceicoccales bacterium]|jgi:subtilisin family serine protease/uncharacterized protein with beta-barrel porin domain/subtilisin-like proprotein convertase family protein|nr:autotransporter domain-containing protein [Puniceicoccales bacterium]
MTKLPLSILLAGATALAASVVSGAPFTPNDPLYPPSELYYGQWHLAATSNLASYFPQETSLVFPWIASVTGDNVTGAWAQGYTGAGVIIGIIDDGVPGDHPDLAANYRGDLSLNFSQGTIAKQPQRPYQTTDGHGTAVAGVAAAVGGNAIGVTGAAPHAQIAGMRVTFEAGLEGDPIMTAADEVDAFLWQSGVDKDGKYLSQPVISVKNNSWGPTVPFQKDDKTVFDALNAASKNGTIFVFAAGNSRGTFSENANGFGLNTLEPAIAVAAFGADGKYSYYSDYGSSIFVTAASANYEGFGIVTTDRVGNMGYADADYYAAFGGTSSSSPLVAGIIALGKEANPAMDVRWAKHAIARTSILVDPTDKSPSSGVLDWMATTLTGRGWQTNGAGLHFNPDYGFGLLDAGAFVKRVVDLAYVTERTTYTLTVPVNTKIANTAGNVIHYVSTSNKSNIKVGYEHFDTVQPSAAAAPAPAAAPRADTNPIVAIKRDYLYSFKLGQSNVSQSLETVELHVNITSGQAWKDLLIQLVSPSGVVSDLYSPLLNAPSTDESLTAALMGLNNGLENWTFTTNAFWGESGVGDWKLLFSNYGDSTMTIKDFSLKFNQGEAVLESALRGPIDKDISAHALVIDNPDTTFTLPAGRTFTVAEGTIQNSGVIDISGRIAETSYKGNQVSIRGGVFTLQAGGQVDAKRGVILSGGVFNLDGKLNTPSGTTLLETTVVEGESSTQNVKYPFGLIVAGGVLNVGDNASVSTGVLQTAGRVNIATGKKLTTPKLEVQGTFTAATETETAWLSTPGNLSLSGTLDGSLLARDGAIVTASGSAKIIGTLTLAGASTSEAEVAQFNVGTGSNVEVTGGVLVQHGNFTINTNTFKTKQITVSGGKAEITTAAVFDTPLTQTGGIVLFHGNTEGATTLNRSISTSGGLLVTSDDVKVFTAPTITVSGSGSFSPGGAAAVTLQVNGDFNLNRGALTLNVTRAASDFIEVSGRTVFRRGTLNLTTDVAPSLADIGTKSIAVIHASGGLRGDIAFVNGREGQAYTLRPAPQLEEPSPGIPGVTPPQEPQPRYYLVPIAYKFHIDDERDTGYVVVGYDYSSFLFTDQLNANQRQIGIALNELEMDTAKDGPTQDPLLLAINNFTDAAEIRSAYDQLMPVHLMALAHSSVKQATALTGTIDRRLRDFRRGALQPGSVWTNYLFAGNYGFDFAAHPLTAAAGRAPTSFVPYTGFSSENPFTVWLNGSASLWKTKESGASSLPTTKSNQYTGVIGFDYRWESGFARRLTTYDVGVALGYNNTTDKIGTSGSQNELSAASISAYFTFEKQGFFAEVMTSYALNSYSFNRNVNIPGLAPAHASAKPDGAQYIAYIGLGYEWQYQDWAHGPIFSAQYTRTDVDGFAESGAGAQNLHTGKQNYDSLLTNIGYRFTKRIRADFATLLPEIRAAWHHDFKDGDVNITSRMNGGLPFSVKSGKVGQDYFTLGLGLTALLTEHISLSLDYDATILQKNMAPQHTVNALMRISF